MPNQMSEIRFRSSLALLLKVQMPRAIKGTIKFGSEASQPMGGSSAPYVVTGMSGLGRGKVHVDSSVELGSIAVQE